MSDPDRWHSAKETAQLLGIGRGRLRVSGLPRVRFGRRCFYLRSDIEAHRPAFEVDNRASFCVRAFTVFPRWTDVHGRSWALTDHPLFETWRGMMDRCYLDRGRDWWWWEYGFRGIRVHEPWHDVVTFIREVVALIGPRPAGCTLDRFPDNGGDYEPGNVRWATDAEQAANRGGKPAPLFCLCRFDCSLLPGVCPFRDVPWEVAAAVAKAELHRIEALRHKPLHSLVQHVHTGAHDDCFACFRQDPFCVLDLLGEVYSPHEHCAAAAGYTHRHLVPLGLFGV